MKVVILLVVVAVVISLIVRFSDDIKLTIKKFFDKDETDLDFPKIEEKNSFSPGEVSIYIESCYFHMTSLPEDEQKDIICYLLKSGTGFGFGSSDIHLSSDLTRNVDFTASFNENVLTIKYQDVGNRIIVSD